MLSATSLGVFFRSAPSTRAIIRSRKLSPGTAVTRTTIWSESTRVPPVTAERSPPDSRMTGADSPVIADSSTLAIPSITSPSAGMISPADTTTSSPRRSWPDGTSSTPSAPRRCATVSARVFRSCSACALPRPSATASDRLAKRTVNHRKAAISHAKTLGSVIARIVTRTLPISTTNMTGFRAMRRGSSLRTLSAAARESSAGSRSVDSAIRASAPRGTARGQAPAGTSGRRRAARRRRAGS